MPRFFVEPVPQGEFYREPCEYEEFCIQGADARHIIRSLRMKKGETLTICDCRGNDYDCRIVGFGEEIVTLRILSARKTEAEPSARVTLYQGLPKSDKFDWIVQKAVELGVYRIVPVLTARCVSRPDEKAMGKKIERWQKIAAEAAKQSGRGILPAVGELLSLRQALEHAGEGEERSNPRESLKLLFYEGGGERILNLVREETEVISVFIGPEGGFEPWEVELAKEKGALPATLGPRILRTETAPLAALTAIMQATGNL